jgi:predicted nuclease with TOPRIM domain
MDGVLVDEVSDDDDIERSDDNAVTMDVDGGVKYVVDALREQLDALRTENRDLHYQLEQRSGQVGFLQAKIETLQEEVKALAPAKKMETADTRPWYKRMFGKQPSSE